MSPGISMAPSSRCALNHLVCPPTVAIVAGQLGQIDECESVPVADALEAAAVFACDRILLDTLNWTIE